MWNPEVALLNHACLVALAQGIWSGPSFDGGPAYVGRDQTNGHLSTLGEEHVLSKIPAHGGEWRETFPCARRVGRRDGPRNAARERRVPDVWEVARSSAFQCGVDILPEAKCHVAADINGPHAHEHPQKSGHLSECRLRGRRRMGTGTEASGSAHTSGPRTQTRPRTTNP